MGNFFNSIAASSKKVSGKAATATAQNSGLNATALPDVKAVKKIKVPPKHPAKQPKPYPIDVEHDSKNFDSSVQEPLDTKIYELHTGLVEDEPVIISTAEFVPLYDSSKNKSDQGGALELKEFSRVINAKTAITVMSSSDDAKAFVEKQKSELDDFSRSEMNQFTALMDVISTTVYRMNLRGTEAGIETLLQRAGYSTTSTLNFSQTKLWQQSLVELKRTLLSHSNTMLHPASRNESASDKDEFLLSDIETAPNDMVRLWLNPFEGEKLPTFDDIIVSSKFKNNKQSFISFKSRQYVNLAPSKIPDRDRFIQNTTGRSENIWFGSNFLTQYISSGKDVVAIANICIKEDWYSKWLLKNKSDLAANFGYALSPTGDNFSVWDHLVGQFPKSVLNVNLDQTGKNKSLSSFSQSYITNPAGEKNHVLTFENVKRESTSYTPGLLYYVDSVLSTSDGKSFDTTRLKTLRTNTQTTINTLLKTIELSGHKYNNDTKKYERELESIDSYIKPLYIVSDLYKNILKKNKSHNVTVISGIDTRSAKSLPHSSNIGTRLAATICKAAVVPVGNYQGVADNLKSQLFILIMNIVLQKEHKVENADTISLVKRNICSILASVKYKHPHIATEIAEATEDYRTFPTKTGHNSDKSSIARIDDSFDAAWQATINGGALAQIKAAAEINSQNNAIDMINYATESHRKIAGLYYLNSVNHAIFNATNYADQDGLWKSLVEYMTIHYTKKIYTGNKDSVQTTSYSGMSKMTYLFGCFDLALRIIAAQTPETLIGTYSTVYQYKNSAQGIVTKLSIYGEEGLVIDKVTKEQVQSYYSINKSSETISKKIEDIKELYAAEDSVTIDQLEKYRIFLENLDRNLSKLDASLSADYEKHLNAIQTLYSTDQTLSNTKTKDLVGLSFTEGQLLLSSYILSEYRDRIRTDSTSESKLSSLPAFADFPKDYINFLNINETELVSYSLLSQYFDSLDFMKEKANNKKILTIGIPPLLTRSLLSTVRVDTLGRGTREGIIRLKVYKLDRLHPDVVYHPRTYLFDMNRFPTRVLENWDFTVFSQTDNDLLNIPTKIYSHNHHTFSLCKNFQEGFSRSFDFLTENEKFELYSNQVISFMLEEYLRWFTDCYFDETRFHNFAQLDHQLTNIDTQYQRFLDTIKKNPASPRTLPKQGTISAIFTDQNGQQFSHEVKPPTTTANVQKDGNNAGLNIQMDETMTSFFTNETLMMKIDHFKRRALYPKKFDRVFSIIIDPDDFTVDETKPPTETLDALKSVGVIIRGTTNIPGKARSPLKHRDTSPGDITYDEYFVTIEPYDLKNINNEHEGHGPRDH